MRLRVRVLVQGLSRVENSIGRLITGDEVGQEDEYTKNSEVEILKAITKLLLARYQNRPEYLKASKQLSC